MTSRIAPGTLGSIDGALRDWSVSRDAMRWTPEPSPEGEPEQAQTLAPAPWFTLGNATIALGRPFSLESAGILRGAGTRRGESPFLASAITGLSDVSGTFPVQLYPGAAERLMGLPVPATETVRQPLADFGRTIADMFRPLFEWVAKMAHDAHRAFFPDRHGRCLRCHPERKPKPLAVDGNEYRRRQRARQKRRRR